MLKITRRIFSLAVAASVIATAMPAMAQTEAGLAPLRIVLNRNTSNLAGFIAEDQKLFEKYGLDVELTIASTGAESNELLASERVDGGTLGLGTSVVAWANGSNLVPLVKYRDGAEVYSIIARQESGISTIADLAGKRVAVTKGTDPETAFILALKAHGLSASDVEIIDARWADHAALLDRGDVDASNSNEPFGTIMLNTLSDKVKLIERLGSYYGNGGFMLLSETIVNEKPEVARGLILAYWEAHKIIRDQPDIALEALKKWLKLDDDTANSSLELFGARPMLTEKTTEDLKINVEILVSGNKIRSAPDVQSWMDKGFVVQNELLQNPDYKAMVE